jgi:energy-coupling factor transporter transmembrane protein EcfT
VSSINNQVIQHKVAGLSFSSVLTLIFVIAKLMGALNWSWLWVFCPLWLPLAVFLGFIAAVGTIGLIILLAAGVVDELNKRKRA